VNDPDWTVGTLYGWAPNFGFFIEHIERKCGRPEVVRRMIENITTQDAARYGRGSVITTLPQDPGQAGKAQVMAYADMLAGHRVKICLPTGDKIVRAGPASATAENAGISLLRGPWNEAFLAEAEQFPKSGHDDQIDTLSDGHNTIAEIRGSNLAGQSNDWSNLPDLS
jgi:predicted phage terminase large subunit-like protein